MRSSWISVRAMLEAAEHAGVERERLLQHAGIDVVETQDVYGWVDVERYDRLVCRAVALSGSPGFGLSWGGSAPMVQLEVIPLLVANAPTLRSGIDAMLMIQGLLHEHPQVSFAVHDEIAVLRTTADASFTPVTSRVIVDLSMIGLKRMLEYYLRGATAVRFAFTHSGHVDAEDYRRIFGDDTEFAAPHNELSFSAQQLDVPQPAHNAELFVALTRHVDGLRARMSARRSYSDRVKLELRSALPRTMDMDETANVLGMSPRSLRRRLGDEGTSYSDLVERTQIELASELLGRPDVAVKAVSYQVGFATPSGFHRAFKRWTGQSPAAFRRARGHGA